MLKLIWRKDNDNNTKNISNSFLVQRVKDSESELKGFKVILLFHTFAFKTQFVS